MQKLIFILSLVIVFYIPSSAGGVDSTFGTNGKVLTDFDTTYIAGNAMLIQPDGKIIVGGAAIANDTTAFSLTRFKANGSLDSTFGNYGRVTTIIRSVSIIYALCLQPDGKIIAAGNSESLMAIARYNYDGSLDSSFSSDGILTRGYTAQTNLKVYSVALQTNGNIIVAGDSYTTTTGSQGYRAMLARFDTDGVADTTFSQFGSGTFKMESFGSGFEHFYSVAIQPDGKIVASGEMRTSTSYEIMIFRYDSTGLKDTTLQSVPGYPAGWVTAFFNTSHDRGRSMEILPDGKVLVAGEMNSLSGDSFNVCIMKFQINGRLDSTFGVNGRVITDFNENEDYATNIKTQADGKIIVAGHTGPSTGDQDFMLIRYNVDGIVDSSFGMNGIFIIDMDSTNDWTKAMAIQPDGLILITGNAATNIYKDYLAMVRYNPTQMVPPSCYASFSIYPDSTSQGIYYGYNQSTGTNLTYLWHFGDGDSSTLQYPTHAYNTPGTYNVCLTVNNGAGCDNTFCDSSFYVFKTEGGAMSELNIVDPSVINDLDENSNKNFNVTLYPVPAENTLYIQCSNARLSEIRIYDLLGQTTFGNKAITSNTSSVDVSLLPPGFFIAEIKTDRGAVKKRWLKF